MEDNKMTVNTSGLVEKKAPYEQGMGREAARIRLVRDYARNVLGDSPLYYGEGLKLELSRQEVVRAVGFARLMFENGVYKNFQSFTPNERDSHWGVSDDKTLIQMSLDNQQMRAILYFESSNSRGETIVGDEIIALNSYVKEWQRSTRLEEGNGNLGYIVLNGPKIIEAEENQAFARAQKPWRHESPSSP